ncbi:HdeD family acid-resistance protein [Embleya sp. NPDC008237]|uniref:HdeD family acid-resistance protein n=1 Tax=Embleya sp. NPDC008237 TaxID=3363978 RepID=UPI0036EA124A
MSPISRDLGNRSAGSAGASRVLLVLALASVVLGAVVLAWPTQTVRVVAVLFGLYLLVSGLMQLALSAGALFSGGMRAVLIVSGLLSVVLGILCLGGGSRSVTVLAVLIGIGWLVRGIAELAGAAATGGLPGRGWVVFFGIVDIVAGIVLIAAPVSSTKVLAVLAGIVLVVLGLIGAVVAIGLGRGRTDATWQAGSASRSSRLP